MHFEFIEGGSLGNGDVDLNLTTKEIAECSTSVGESLAVQEMQPSGTMAYRFLKRLFDLVFSLCVSVALVIPVAIVCAFICLESPENRCTHRSASARAVRL